MDLISFAALLAIYIYAFLYAKSILYILIFYLLIYSIISIIIDIKNKSTAKSKVITSFFNT